MRKSGTYLVAIRRPLLCKECGKKVGKVTIDPEIGSRSIDVDNGVAVNYATNECTCMKCRGMTKADVDKLTGLVEDLFEKIG